MAVCGVCGRVVIISINTHLIGKMRGKDGGKTMDAISQLSRLTACCFAVITLDLAG